MVSYGVEKVTVIVVIVCVSWTSMPDMRPAEVVLGGEQQTA